MAGSGKAAEAEESGFDSDIDEFDMSTSSDKQRVQQKEQRVRFGKDDSDAGSTAESSMKSNTGSVRTLTHQLYDDNQSSFRVDIDDDRQELVQDQMSFSDDASAARRQRIKRRCARCYMGARGWYDWRRHGKGCTLLAALLGVVLLLAVSYAAISYARANRTPIPFNPNHQQPQQDQQDQQEPTLAQDNTTLPDLNSDLDKTLITDRVDNSSPTDHERFQAIVRSLEPYSETQQLNTLGTPQHKAVNWLAHLDPRQLDPAHPNLKQRYALAAVYFAMEGFKWDMEQTPVEAALSNSADWLSPRHECEWKFIACEDMVHFTTSHHTRRHLRQRLSKVPPPQGRTVHGADPEFVDIFEGVDNAPADHSDRVSVGIHLHDENKGDNLDNTLVRINEEIEFGNLAEGYVVELKLPNKMEGGIMLPNEIGVLDSLRYLDISSNDIVGEIPVTIGSIQSLQTLILSDNRFMGEIPESLGNLANIQVLKLGNNKKIEGQVPQSLCELFEHSSTEVFPFVPEFRLPGSVECDCCVDAMFDFVAPGDMKSTTSTTSTSSTKPTSSTTSVTTQTSSTKPATTTVTSTEADTTSTSTTTTTSAETDTTTSTTTSTSSPTTVNVTIVEQDETLVAAVVKNSKEEYYPPDNWTSSSSTSSTTSPTSTAASIISTTKTTAAP